MLDRQALAPSRPRLVPISDGLRRSAPAANAVLLADVRGAGAAQATHRTGPRSVAWGTAAQPACLPTPPGTRDRCAGQAGSCRRLAGAANGRRARRGRSVPSAARSAGLSETNSGLFTDLFRSKLRTLH